MKKAKPKKKYSMDSECNTTFAHQERLKDNMKIHSSEKLFKSEICEKKFSQKKNLVKHNKLHNGEKPFQCEKCDKKFTAKCVLLRHSKIHTGEKPFECEICGRKFNYKANLSIHSRIHTGEKPFQCEKCDKKFALKGYLLDHSRIHTGEKPFQCEKCEKKFGAKCVLLRHSRIHTGEKPFQCVTCDKKFPTKPDLLRHSRIHTGEKLFQCDICEWKFVQKVSLLRHSRIHTGEKPFQCEICDKKFALKGNLLRHNKIHTNEKSFQCEICEKKFTRRDNIISHLRSHNVEKLFKCQICKKKCTYKHRLKDHMQVHTGVKPFKCKKCEIKFTYKRNMISHMRSHTGKKLFKCNICGKGYTQNANLKMHLRIHTGKRPFQCELCKKKFKRKQHMSIHMKTHSRDIKINNIKTSSIEINEEEDTVKVEYHHLYTENSPDLVTVKSENDSIESVNTYANFQSTLIPLIPEPPNNVDNIVRLNVYNDTRIQLKEEFETESQISNESFVKNRVTHQSNGREWLIDSESNIDNRVIHEGNAGAIDTVTAHRNHVKELQDKISTNPLIRVEYHHLYTENSPELVTVKPENDSIESVKTLANLQNTLIPLIPEPLNNGDNIGRLNVYNDTIIQVKEESETESQISNESVVKNRVAAYRNHIKELQDKISTNPFIRVEYHHLYTENSPELVTVKSENDSIESVKTHANFQNTLIPLIPEPSNNVDNIGRLNIYNDTIIQVKEESETESQISNESIVKNRVTHQSNRRECLIDSESNIDNRVIHEGNAGAIDTVTAHRNHVKELQDKISTNPLIRDCTHTSVANSY